MVNFYQGLTDQWGRPIEKAALTTEQAAPTLGSVRRYDNYSAAAGLEPGRLARMLREAIDGYPEPYLALAEDMEERDPHYASVLSTRKLQVSGLDISVEAADDTAAAQQHADLVREIIARDNFEVELRDILDAVGKGFSATEIVWDTSEGQWRPKKLAWRDPRWFRFDIVDGETPLLRDDAGFVPLKPFGWIFHQFKAKSGIPIRGGLARGAAWTFLFKSFTGKDWAIFCEAYGQPLRLGKWAPGASETDKETLLEAVTNIGADFAAIVPQAMSVEFVQAQLTGSLDLYEKRSDWLDKQVSKLVLGQTSTTDAQRGSYAVGRVHDEVRQDIETADAKALAATLNRDLGRPAVDLNFGPQKAYPKIHIRRPDSVDVDQLVKNVSMLVPLGLKVGMSTMRDKIGLPDPDPDEELLTPAQGGAPAPDPAIADQQAFSAHAGRATDMVERSVGDILGDEGWEPLVAPIVAGLGDQIAAASTMDEVKAILQKRFADLDATALTDKLAEAVFSSRLAGEANETL
jgi:phage gp29-like protein